MTIQKEKIQILKKKNQEQIYQLKKRQKWIFEKEINLQIKK